MILNACDTRSLAAYVVREMPHLKVVYWGGDLEDDLALKFAEQLYLQLGMTHGVDLKDAFVQGEAHK